jgi:hypothetical protein
MEPKPVAEPVEQSPHGQFRRRIARADRGHRSFPLRWREVIGHRGQAGVRRITSRKGQRRPIVESYEPEASATAYGSSSSSSSGSIP